ncbi:MAG: FAD-dependent oxidoreductase, partial [Polyangiaceae bacterium]
MGGARRTKVAIFGGGIAGMSAAHELIERGFDVEVFEHKSIPGGKARSLASKDVP